MKVIEKRSKIEKFGDLQESTFNLDPKNARYITRILRDQLYSDKVLAVIREYTTNAIDAHVEAGIPNTPIIVTLPTSLKPEFKVRDFGQGLTNQEVFEIYCQYAESTKRHSNNFTGQMGIGAKCGFAYNDSFMIVSYKDGVKYTYDAFLDGDDAKVTKLAEETTEEKNGIEIIIAVKNKDVNEFISKSQKLFRYFDVRPEVRGAKITYPDVDKVLEGKTWYIPKGRRSSTYYSTSYTYDDAIAIMGNIGYKITSHNIAGLSAVQQEILKSGIVIKFPIGSLEMAASREELQYTEITKKSIKKRLEKIEKEIFAEISKEIKGATSLLDAKYLLYKYTNSSNIVKNLLYKAQNNAGIEWTDKWGNKHQIISAEISRKDIYVDKDDWLSVGIKEAFYKRGKLQSDTISLFAVTHNNFKIYEDDVKGYRWLQRSEVILEELQKANPGIDRLLVWKFDDDKRDRLVAELCKHFCISEKDIVKLSSIDLESNSATATKYKKVLDKIKCPSFHSAGYHWGITSYWKVASQYEIDVDTTDTIYYVRFYAHRIRWGSHKLEPSYLKKLCKFAQSHLNINETVYGVKDRDYNKIKDNKNFVPYIEYVLEKAKKKFSITDTMVSKIYFDRLKGVQHLNLNIDAIKNYIRRDSPFIKYLDTVKDMKGKIAKWDQEDYQQYYEIHKIFSTEEEKKDISKNIPDINKLKLDMEKIYPLLRYLDIWKTGTDRQRNSFYSGDGSQLSDIIEYINLIDKCKCHSEKGGD